MATRLSPPVSPGGGRKSAESSASSGTHFGSRPLTPSEYAHAQALVTATLARQYKPTDNDHSEHEIQLADFEVKIRQYILDLLQPTIRRTAALEHEFTAVQEDVAIKSAQIAELMRVSSRVEQQMSTVDGFRAELSRFDAERRQWQAEATEGLATMKQDQDAFRYQMERQDASIHSAHRTVDRIAGELGRIQEVADGLRAHTDKRLGAHNNTLNTFKTELEVKLVSLESRHNKLCDDLWGEETGLAKLTHDLDKTNEIVNTMTADLHLMRHDKASISQLQAIQEEASPHHAPSNRVWANDDDASGIIQVNTFTNEANANVNTLKQTVDRMMNDLKEHFRTATNTVAAHNAAMLQEAADFLWLRAMPLGAYPGISFTLPLLHEHDSATPSSASDTAARPIAGRQRRRDRNTSEVEIKQLQHALENVPGTEPWRMAGLEHLSGVIWTIALGPVQCERAASASGSSDCNQLIRQPAYQATSFIRLDQQDNDDRGKVALMGYKAEMSFIVRLQCDDASFVTMAGGKDKAAAKMPAKARAAPIMSVDQRCLSCSGKANTVLAGLVDSVFDQRVVLSSCIVIVYYWFHLTGRRKFYNRNDLLDLRGKLLLQAHDSLQNGPIPQLIRLARPVSFHKTDYFESKPAGIPSGGVVADLLAAAKSPSPPLAKAEDSERPRSRNSTPRLG
ncbi:unnamed protein product, partial [Polarella glacialis]